MIDLKIDTSKLRAEIGREIARQDGDTSMSATVRRLIREEAARRGIAVTAPAYSGAEAAS